MKLTMQLGSRSYDIILKSGCLANLYQFANVANRKVFILTDSGVPEQYAQTVLAQCPNGMVYTVPQGEASKSLKVYGQVLQAMLEFNMTRKDLLVAVGGGVVGDLGGFCAKTRNRNVGSAQNRRLRREKRGRPGAGIGSAKPLPLCSAKSLPVPLCSRWGWPPSPGALPPPTSPRRPPRRSRSPR